MAIKWLDVNSYNRQGSVKRGQRPTTSIASHARYIVREASAMETHAKHVVRQRNDVEWPKEDLVTSGHLHMPAWVGDDPLAYWKMADIGNVRDTCKNRSQ